MAEEGIEQKREGEGGSQQTSIPTIKKYFFAQFLYVCINVCAIKIILLVRCIVRKLNETC